MMYKVSGGGLAENLLIPPPGRTCPSRIIQIFIPLTKGLIPPLNNNFHVLTQ